jgi:hypothetical protein
MNIYQEAKNMKENVMTFALGVLALIAFPFLYVVYLIQGNKALAELAKNVILSSLVEIPVSLMLIISGILLSPVYLVAAVVNIHNEVIAEQRLSKLSDAVYVQREKTWLKTLAAEKATVENGKSWDATINSMSLAAMSSMSTLNDAQNIDDKDWSSTTSFSSDQAAASKNSVAKSDLFC